MAPPLPPPTGQPMFGAPGNPADPNSVWGQMGDIGNRAMSALGISPFGSQDPKDYVNDTQTIGSAKPKIAQEMKLGQMLDGPAMNDTSVAANELRQHLENYKSLQADTADFFANAKATHGPNTLQWPQPVLDELSNRSVALDEAMAHVNMARFAHASTAKTPPPIHPANVDEADKATKDALKEATTTALGAAATKASGTGNKPLPPPPQAPQVPWQWNYAKPGPFQTQLGPEEEKRFKTWVKENKIPFDNSPTADYDMRGFWRNGGRSATAINANDGKPHFPDTYKTPYHVSFSNESKYATPDAPRWINDHQLADRNGKVLYDEIAH